jgi:hypothetical protein
MRRTTGALIGVALVFLGVALAALPKTWIEETLGFEPDAGSGALELAISLVLVAVGLALIIKGFLTDRAHGGQSAGPLRQGPSDAT